MYCKELTRDQLIAWGFKFPKYNSETNTWEIWRNWRTSGPKIGTKTVLKQISVTKAVCKHKYTNDKVYLKITFCVHGKAISIPLSRFIWVWYNGIAHEGMDIEHIDNDPFNNNIFNLRECTRSENLAKRFLDNPKTNCNQWEAIKNKN